MTMRTAAILVVSLLSVGSVPRSAGAQSRLDQPLPLPTRTAAHVGWIPVAPLAEGETAASLPLVLVRGSGVPMVFEVDAEHPLLAQPLAVVGRTVRESLDAFTRANPTYSWREQDGVVVVRPSHAWSDPRCPFNRSVEGVP